MAFRMFSALFALIYCVVCIHGQPLNPENQSITSRILQLEKNQVAFRLELDQILDNLGAEMKDEVERRLPGLLKTALKDLFKSSDVTEILKGTTSNEVRKLGKKYRRLRKQVKESEMKISILEVENDKLEEKFSVLRENMTVLKQSCQKQQDRGEEGGEVTPTPVDWTTVSETELNTTEEWITVSETEFTTTVDLATVSENELTATVVDATAYENWTSTVGPSGETTRILILPWGHQQPQQMNMETLALTDYPLELRGYQSCVYSSETNSVISTVIEPFNFGNKIRTADLDSSEERVMISGQAAEGIALDESRDLMIFSTIRPSKTVSSADLNGSDVSVIASLSGYNYAYSVDVDPTSETIFICVQDQLLSVKYDGTDLKTVYRGSDINAVSVDSSERAVYFNDGTELIELSLVDGATTSVADLGYIPWKFIHYREGGSSVLYVSSFRGKKIGKVELEKSRSYVPILDGCEKCRFVTSICLLPLQ